MSRALKDLSFEIFQYVRDNYTDKEIFDITIFDDTFIIESMFTPKLGHVCTINPLPHICELKEFVNDWFSKADPQYTIDGWTTH